MRLKRRMSRRLCISVQRMLRPVVEQLIAMGATPARMQLQALQGQLYNRFEVPHPCMSWREEKGGRRKEETKLRRSRGEEQQAARWVNQRQGGRNEEFPAGSVLDPSGLSKNACEGDGEDFNSPRRVRKRQTCSQQISHSNSFSPWTVASVAASRR